MSQPFDVAGYMYRGDLYCPDHIVDTYRRDRRSGGHQLDSIAAPGTVDTETWLDERAAMRGINRYDETTFDSGQFPKIIFDDQVEETDCCAECGEPL